MNYNMMHMQNICIIEYLSMMIRIQNKFSGKVRSSLLILGMVTCGFNFVLTHLQSSELLEVSRFYGL